MILQEKERKQKMLSIQPNVTTMGMRKNNVQNHQPTFRGLGGSGDDDFSPSHKFYSEEDRLKDTVFEQKQKLNACNAKIKSLEASAENLLKENLTLKTAIENFKSLIRK